MNEEEFEQTRKNPVDLDYKQDFYAVNKVPDARHTLFTMLKKGESEKIEFKRSTAQIERALKAICGFLNHKGGAVYFGISDKNELLGQDAADSTLKTISQKVRQKIKPEVSPEIKVFEIKSKKIIEVKIAEGANKPYYLDGIAYKRVGTENPPIAPEELERIILKNNKIQWDSQICEEASLDDIDWVFVEKKFIPLYEGISKNQIAGRQRDILASIGCIKNNKPTNAGMMLFGKEPQKVFSNSYIALARYKGNEVSIERLDYREFDGNLFEQIDMCNAYILEHTALMSTLEPGEVRRIDIPEYGRFSLRELITNAVCHRDYENQHTKIIVKMFVNRIEFYNPGGLAKDITPENIAEKQFSRNPVISRVLAKVDYIEELGEGWDKIIREHKNHPLKPDMPKINADASTTLITIFSIKDKFEEPVPKSAINIRQKKIIEYMKEHERITRKECIRILSTSKDTAFRELDFLQEKGIIRRMGKGRNVYYVFA